VRRARISFPDPFGGWGALALKSAEMFAACAAVIPHRTSRPNTPSQLATGEANKHSGRVESPYHERIHQAALQARTDVIS
jgi:hypothetical protein